MGKDKRIAPRWRRRADEVAAYINDCLGEPLDTATLCKRFHMSGFTLRRIFQAAYNKPPHRYISDKRLQRARNLLVKTDLPVKQIYSRVGFRSRSGFSRSFRRKYKLSPNPTGTSMGAPSLAETGDCGGIGDYHCRYC